MWTKNDSKTGINWENALAWAQIKNSLNYLGHNDWRLPTAKELQSIVDYTRSKDHNNAAAIDPVFNISAITDEGGTQNWPFFWTNTTHLDNMGGVYFAFGEALGYMKMPPSVSYFTLVDVHGAGAQRSDPKKGDPDSLIYYLGLNQVGDSVFGRGPQGDVQRIDNYVRLVRNAGPANINEYKNDDMFNVFPNPVLDVCSILFNERYPHIKIQIFNSVGCKIREADICKGNSASIDLSGFQEGVYFISATTETGTAFSKKIIVAR